MPTMPARTTSGSFAEATGRAELRVDRVACTGHGICASIVPRSVQLDEWGYPVLSPEAGTEDPQATAAAVRLCPAMALYLVRGV